MSDTVTIRALATLAPYAPPGGVASIGPGETVGELADRLGIEPEALGTVLVNDAPAGLDAERRPQAVPPLVLESDADRRRNREAAARREARLQERRRERDSQLQHQSENS